RRSTPARKGSAPSRQDRATKTPRRLSSWRLCGPSLRLCVAPSPPSGSLSAAHRAPPTAACRRPSVVFLRPAAHDFEGIHRVDHHAGLATGYSLLRPVNSTSETTARQVVFRWLFGGHLVAVAWRIIRPIKPPPRNVLHEPACLELLLARHQALLIQPTLPH